MMLRNLAALTAVVVFLSAAGCGKKTEVAQTVNPASLRMFAPLPAEMPSPAGEPTAQLVDLGRMLYYETRLSAGHNISCNSCHKLDAYGVDGEVTSDGHKGQKGTRNSPTVYNSAGHMAQFWDGRAANVEEQAKGPVTNPVEMALADGRSAERVLKSIPGYVEAFKAAFPKDKDPITFDNMAIAIGAFERKLITPSRWDRFIQGDQAALTNAEKAGFNTFISAGCQTCHSGALLGASMYQKLGVIKPYPDQDDPGRAQVTKNDADKMVFKVPSLRNIEKTGPYFHDGKVGTLQDAVARMSEYQVGQKLTDAQIQSIVTWLKSLTGQIPVEYIKPPALPPSGPTTPKPAKAG
jgi:cytochrome c peroxidase